MFQKIKPTLMHSDRLHGEDLRGQVAPYLAHTSWQGKSSARLPR